MRGYVRKDKTHLVHLCIVDQDGKVQILKQNKTKISISKGQIGYKEYIGRRETPTLSGICDIIKELELKLKLLFKKCVLGALNMK